MATGAAPKAFRRRRRSVFSSHIGPVQLRFAESVGLASDVIGPQRLDPLRPVLDRSHGALLLRSLQSIFCRPGDDNGARLYLVILGQRPESLAEPLTGLRL